MYDEVVRDFALRTEENLEAIDAHQRLDAGVFELTQSVNSLGLFVFRSRRMSIQFRRSPSKNCVKLAGQSPGSQDSAGLLEWRGTRHLSWSFSIIL